VRAKLSQTKTSPRSRPSHGPLRGASRDALGLGLSEAPRHAYAFARGGAPCTRYERSWRELGATGAAVADLARSVSRAGELSDAPLHGTFAWVLAPLLFAFVDDVLQRCTALGIRELAFLARDGQLLYRIAQRMIEARGLPLRARYVYGSRRALHLAGYQRVDAAESWLLDDTHTLSLDDVAARGEIPPALLYRAAARHGYHDASADIPRRERARLRAVIREPEVQSALADTAARHWGAAHAYYQRMGFRPGARVALVDVGWAGRMQRSLRGVLERAGGAPPEVHGFYLCLDSRVETGPHDHLYGFLYDPARDRGRCPVSPYRAVVEAALAADHATTQRFRFRPDGVADAELGAPPAAAVVQLARAQQSSVLAFVDGALALEAARGEPLRLPVARVYAHLRWMLEAPERSDAACFACRPHFDGQGDTQMVPLARSVALGELLRGRRVLGMWPEASCRLSGTLPLLWCLRLLRWLRPALATLRGAP
jgi:hypothetical protein